MLFSFYTYLLHSLSHNMSKSVKFALMGHSESQMYHQTLKKKAQDKEEWQRQNMEPVSEQSTWWWWWGCWWRRQWWMNHWIKLNNFTKTQKSKMNFNYLWLWMCAVRNWRFKLAYNRLLSFYVYREQKQLYYTFNVGKKGIYQNKKYSQT